MRHTSTLRSLKCLDLRTAYFASPILQQRRSRSPISPSSQHLNFRSLHATNHSLTTPQPHPQLDKEQEESGQETEPTPNPLIYPSRATPSNHHDLSSFLSYAERANLPPKSTVYVGTHYEYTVQESLASHGFTLRRVGGASDYGIDLLGTWSLPSLPHPLRVIVQCKALASPRPASIRELEGAFVGAPAGWRRGEGVIGSNVVGLLVAPGQSTKGVRDAISRSRWPMGFVSCAQDTGAVRQFIWNQAAVREGLEGVGVAFRHDESGEEPRLVLTWKGRPIAASCETEDIGN
ncbi:hypothetical protein BR93DRAFT_973742 [Coniochaeta sp. PMI_546]|nr:hypothetical protein BR93DRAFT_973742 [Coniochaeta sp. PMI_546]